MTAALSLDGSLLRRAARWGSRGPEWFVRIAPPLVALVVCALATEPRRAIARNLRRVRGRRPALVEATDVARTFVAYASCLAETLGAGSRHAAPPRAVVRGDLHLVDALAAGGGAVLVTAHTAGWEIVGPLLARDQGRPVTIVEALESDAKAARIQDDARRVHGLHVAHAGDDPLTAIALAKQLRGGGVVALQIDRAPPAVRTRRVTMFGREARMPEGPLRLAMLTGAPLVPAFVSRTGHRGYEVSVRPPVHVARAATDADIDRAAQQIALELERFARANPTQWFHFRSE